MKKILLIFILAFVTVANAQQTKYQKIDSLLTFLSKNNRFMGSVALRENNKTVYEKAYGFADTESNKKLDVNTKLKIGSITKTFTATMIMQLVEEKKLSLNTKLSQFYPNIPNAEKITIGMLLYQRTGIPDFLNDDPEVGNYIYVDNKREEIINRIEKYTPAFEPDSQFKYSNSNYNLLGYILEDITKKSFSDNLNARIVKKLKLKNTTFPQKIEVTKNEGFSFIFDGKQWVKVPEWNNSLAFAAGAISSTPTDLTIFMEGLFSGKLVTKSSLDQMKTIKEGYGMALIDLPFNEKKFYGHTGGIESFRAVVGYNDVEKFGTALIVSGDNFNRNDIMIGILSLYYGEKYSFPDLSVVPVKDEILQKYVGTYSSKTLPLKITITTENGILNAQATGQGAFPLTAKSETEFFFTAAGIRMNFTENAFTLNQSGVKYEYTKN